VTFGFKYFNKICIETSFIRCANKCACELLKAAFISADRIAFFNIII